MKHGFLIWKDLAILFINFAKRRRHCSKSSLYGLVLDVLVHNKVDKFNDEKLQMHWIRDSCVENRWS